MYQNKIDYLFQLKLIIIILPTPHTHTIMSLGTVGNTEVCKVEFHPYNSLEQFRNALVDKYLQIYNQVIVQEKLDGSNIQIMGQYVCGNWNFLLGSRPKVD